MAGDSVSGATELVTDLNDLSGAHASIPLSSRMTNTDDGVGRRAASRGWHHVCVLAERRSLPTQARGARTNLCSTCAITASAATLRNCQMTRERPTAREREREREKRTRKMQEREEEREELPENYNFLQI